MKVGRNDPCPCGSGKKYKKCCLAADEARIHAVVAPPGSAPDQPGPPPPSEHEPADPATAAMDEALDQRYEQFEAADTEGKMAMFLRLVRGEGDVPMGREEAVEMLGHIHHLLAQSNQRPRFDALVEALRRDQPELYEQSKALCLGWSISNRAAQGLWDELADPVKELAALAERDIDALRRLMDMLAFHGQLPLLVQAVRIAWPELKKSQEVLPWAIEEFAGCSSLYEVFDYIEQHPDASGEEEELLQRLRPYADQGEELTWVSGYLTHLMRNVPAARVLDLADFDLKRPKRKGRRRNEDEDESGGEEDETGPERALVDLSTTFLGWMRRARNVPLTRGEAGRAELVQFLFERADGRLDDRRSLIERMMEPDRKLPKQPIVHPLCPDRIRLDAYLARQLDMLTWRIYDAAALVHVTPLWLEFLELNGLLTAEQRRKARRSLNAMLGLVRELLSGDDDPRLMEALDTWAE